MKTAPSSKNPHRDPKVLCARGKAWVECRCGWTGPSCPSPAEASRSWASHVARAEGWSR